MVIGRLLLQVGRIVRNRIVIAVEILIVVLLPLAAIDTATRMIVEADGMDMIDVTVIHLATLMENRITRKGRICKEMMVL